MSLWWSGVAAGISIGFSFLAQAALAAHLPSSELKHAIAALGYPAGFLIVILGRQQLITENVLTAVLPVMTHWKLSWFSRMLRLWRAVLAANVAGCFVFGCAFAFLPIASENLISALAGLLQELMQNTPFEMSSKGI